MDLLKQYILPIAVIIGFFVLDYRNRHRRILLKRALCTNFIWSSFLSIPHLRIDMRVAFVMFLFIFSVTSLGAVGRWNEQRRHLAKTDSQLSLQKDES